MTSSQQPTVAETFARRVHLHRQRQGLSQADLARLLEGSEGAMDQSALARLEGLKRGAKVEEAVALARALRVPLYALVTDADTEAEMARDARLGAATATLERIERAVAEAVEAERQRLAQGWLMGPDGQGRGA